MLEVIDMCKLFRKKLTLDKYIKSVMTGHDAHRDIIIEGTEREKELLDKLCDIIMPENKTIEIWEEILGGILDSPGMIDHNTILSKKVLNYLIDNDIALITLGHFQLDEQWLQKIYDRNNRCTEALLTIKKRKGLMD